MKLRSRKLENLVDRWVDLQQHACTPVPVLVPVPVSVAVETFASSLLRSDFFDYGEKLLLLLLPLCHPTRRHSHCDSRVLTSGTPRSMNGGAKIPATNRQQQARQAQQARIAHRLLD